jgi:hypothetical protein
MRCSEPLSLGSLDGIHTHEELNTDVLVLFTDRLYA